MSAPSAPETLSEAPSQQEQDAHFREYDAKLKAAQAKFTEEGKALEARQEFWAQREADLKTRYASLKSFIDNSKQNGSHFNPEKAEARLKAIEAEYPSLIQAANAALEAPKKAFEAAKLEYYGLREYVAAIAPSAPEVAPDAIQEN